MSYREPCVPFEIGQPRVKLWRRSEPCTPESESMWRERAAAYWERQSQLYGVRFDFTLRAAENEDCVCSRATVTELLAQ